MKMHSTIARFLQNSRLPEGSLVASGDPLDLGNDHKLQWLDFKPNRDAAEHLKGVPDISRAACQIVHKNQDGQECRGLALIHQGQNTVRVFGAAPTWHIFTEAPLDLGPTFDCAACGDAGSVIEGRWVKKGEA